VVRWSAEAIARVGAEKSSGLLLVVIARNGMEGLFGFPANVGICCAVLAVREGADDAECRGVEVVVRVLAVGCEREAEAHDERPVDTGLVEQLELVGEELGVGLFVSEVYGPHAWPDERPQDRYCHSQHGQWCRVEGAEDFGVVGVPAGSEAELGDRDRLPGCLELADLGQVLVGGGGLLAVIVDADNVKVVPVDPLERLRAVADRPL
jgi:hypothetical protein